MEQRGAVEKGRFYLKNHIYNILKEQLNKAEADLDQVQNAELALRWVHTEDKVESRIVSVDQLVVGATDETENGYKCYMPRKSHLSNK